MKVKDLIAQLLQMDADAEARVVNTYHRKEFSIAKTVNCGSTAYLLVRQTAILNTSLAEWASLHPLDGEAVRFETVERAREYADANDIEIVAICGDKNH